MSWEKFEDDCPGCRPALVDIRTGLQLPESSPEMQAVLSFWKTTTRREREVFHRVTCNNSRDQQDVKVFFKLSKRMEEALKSETKKASYH